MLKKSLILIYVLIFSYMSLGFNFFDRIIPELSAENFNNTSLRNKLGPVYKYNQNILYGNRINSFTDYEYAMYPSVAACIDQPVYNSINNVLMLHYSIEQWVKLELEDTPYNEASHPASSHTSPYPVGELVGVTEGVFFQITDHYYVTYKAPQNSGLYKIKVTRRYPEYDNQEQVVYVYVYVGIPDLVNVKEPGSESLITFNNITSHPNDGTYMHEDAKLFLLNAMAEYRVNAEDLSVPTGNIVIPNSEGLSLEFGGLFDVSKNWLTTPLGHCSHRYGIDADIGMSLFKASSYKEDLLDALELAILDNNYDFPYDNESPDADAAHQAASNFHWHIRYTPPSP